MNKCNIKSHNTNNNLLFKSNLYKRSKQDNKKVFSLRIIAKCSPKISKMNKIHKAQIFLIKKLTLNIIISKLTNSKINSS